MPHATTFLACMLIAKDPPSATVPYVSAVGSPPALPVTDNTPSSRRYSEGRGGLGRERGVPGVPAITCQSSARTDPSADGLEYPPPAGRSRPRGESGSSGPAMPRPGRPGAERFRRREWFPVGQAGPGAPVRGTSPGRSLSRTLSPRAATTAPVDCNGISGKDEGDQAALGELLAAHRKRLLGLIRFRMHTQLRGRVDPEDILQEAYLAAVKRLHHYQADPSVSLFVWLRSMVLQTLADLHRHHLGVQKRDPRREISLQVRPRTQATSASIVLQLTGDLTSRGHDSGARGEAPVRAALRARTSTESPPRASSRPLRRQRPAFVYWRAANPW